MEFTINIFSFYLLGPEYGTMEAAWKGILTEADRLSDVHLKVKENLSVEVIQEIKTWQKDSFHKVKKCMQLNYKVYSFIYFFNK